MPDIIYALGGRSFAKPWYSYSENNASTYNANMYINMLRLKSNIDKEFILVDYNQKNRLFGVDLIKNTYKCGKVTLQHADEFQVKHMEILRKILN